MPRVIIADDHTLMRQSLSKLVADTDGFEVVGEAARGDEVLALVAGTEPDVLLVDIEMPGADGLSIAQMLNDEGADVRVLFVTMHDEDAALRQAVRANAAGFVSKAATTDELLNALKVVAAGGSYLSPSIARRMMDLAAGRAAGAAQTLTERESEVLALLANGARPAEIAAQLYLSVKTVKNHLTSVYAKLGVSTGAQAVAEAYRQGLVQTVPA